VRVGFDLRVTRLWRHNVNSSTGDRHRVYFTCCKVPQMSSDWEERFRPAFHSIAQPILSKPFVLCSNLSLARPPSGSLISRGI
jgi:hypothetical protein